MNDPNSFMMVIEFEENSLNKIIIQSDKGRCSVVAPISNDKYMPFTFELQIRTMQMEGGLLDLKSVITELAFKHKLTPKITVYNKEE